MYRHFFKRFLDIILSALALIILSPVYLVLAILVRAKLGSPVIFKQQRPGRIDKKTGKERIFTLYKFRSMTDKRDSKGNLLPDSERLTKFGKALRSTSLDELPEIWNILKGDMSIVGPRPQLVRDMVFMTQEQRQRHIVRPGLTGLAQVNGRNAITWDEKLKFDQQYVSSISFALDLTIFFQTIGKVLQQSDISEEGMDTGEDLGDALLKEGRIDTDEYFVKLNRAIMLLDGNKNRK